MKDNQLIFFSFFRLYRKITNKIHPKPQKYDFQIHEDQKPESNMYTKNTNSTRQKTENFAQLDEGEFTNMLFYIKPVELSNNVN
jgi:hypothetical protein